MSLVFSLSKSIHIFDIFSVRNRPDIDTVWGLDLTWFALHHNDVLLVVNLEGCNAVAGVVGIAGCVVGLVSTMINLAGQSLLIQVPLEDGHNVYVYISPNMTSFA